MITWPDEELETERFNSSPTLPGKGGVGLGFQLMAVLNSETMLRPLTVASLQPAFSHREAVEACPSASFPACPTWRSSQLWPLNSGLGCHQHLAPAPHSSAAADGCSVGLCPPSWLLRNRFPASDEGLCRPLVQDKASWQAAFANTAALWGRRHPRWPEH